MNETKGSSRNERTVKDYPQESRVGRSKMDNVPCRGVEGAQLRRDPVGPEIIEGIFHELDQLTDLLQRLENRLSGIMMLPTPINSKDGSDRPGYPGRHIDQLSDVREKIHRHGATVEDIMDRLEF